LYFLKQNNLKLLIDKLIHHLVILTYWRRRRRRREEEEGGGGGAGGRRGGRGGRGGARGGGEARRAISAGLGCGGTDRASSSCLTRVYLASFAAYTHQCEERNFNRTQRTTQQQHGAVLKEGGVKDQRGDQLK
jgi:hypothetical protein